MAKKKKVEVEEPQIEETVVETAPVVKQPKIKEENGERLHVCRPPL